MAYDFTSGLITAISDWKSRGLDTNGKVADPQLASPIAPNYDFHLKSGSQAIDAGDPSFPVDAEPQPSGNRINAGCFGGTAEAATTQGGTP